MYKLQDRPDDGVVLTNGSIYTPIATLKDEYGGISHIIVDDYCYVLVNGSGKKGFTAVTHWYKETVEALVKLITGEIVI